MVCKKCSCITIESQINFLFTILILFTTGVTGLLMMCAFFVDIIVWYKAGSINFEDDHQLPVNEEELSQLTPITDKTETTV